MTKKLLEIERKHQLTTNIEELIGRLQDIGFKLQTATHTKNDVIIKPETNLPIQPGDAAIAKQLLTSLGMVQLVDVNKYRRSFQSSDFPQATVAIDEIKDAGTFVEVEVLSDDETDALAMINDIETKLGLESAEVVMQPYRDICINRKPPI